MKQMLVNNSYPVSFVDATIKKVMDTHISREQPASACGACRMRGDRSMLSSYNFVIARYYKVTPPKKKKKKKVYKSIPRFQVISPNVHLSRSTHQTLLKC